MKRLFSIDEKIVSFLCNKNVYLYGFDEIVKGVFIKLIMQGITVKGFVVDDDKYTGKREYLSIPFVGIEEVNKRECILVDAIGDNLDYLCRSTEATVRQYANLFLPNEKCIIYGTGTWGRRVNYLLKERGIDILAFADYNQENVGGRCCGKPIITPEALRGYEKDISVVVCMQRKAVKNVIDSLLDQVDNESIWISEEELNPYLDLYDEYDNRIVIEPIVVNRLSQTVSDRNKTIIIGKYVYAKQLAKAFETIGITVDYCVSTDRQINETGFKNIFEMVYEDPKETSFLVLEGSEYNVEMFLDETGMTSESFFTIKQWVRRLSHKLCYDPINGYTLSYLGEKGILKISTSMKTSATPIRIGVLGGSTSDLRWTDVKPWCEFLIDIAEKNEKEIELFVSATIGYTVSQETISLMRDILPLKPDLIISYSALNEFFGTVYRKGFVNRCSETLFRKICNTKSIDELYVSRFTEDLFYGYSEVGYGEHWLNQERIMHGICKEFGIDFFAIMAPTLFDKRLKSADDNNIMELLEPHYYDRYIESMKEIQTYMNNYKNSLNENYFKDFTHVFDEINENVFIDAQHLNDAGNRIIAGEIYRLVTDEVKE